MRSAAVLRSLAPGRFLSRSIVRCFTCTPGLRFSFSRWSRVLPFLVCLHSFPFTRLHVPLAGWPMLLSLRRSFHSSSTFPFPSSHGLKSLHPFCQALLPSYLITHLPMSFVTFESICEIVGISNHLSLLTCPSRLELTFWACSPFTTIKPSKEKSWFMGCARESVLSLRVYD